MNDFKNKRVLITGATGLIGRHLTEKLVKSGASVIVVGRSRNKLEKVFAEILNYEHLSILEGDVAKTFPVNNTYLDYIFHAASPISGLEIRTKPVDTISANIDGLRNCLEYLKNQESGRLIVFSSATVYGNYDLSKDVIVTEDMTDKADALHTQNTPYSESKRMIEVMSRAYLTQYKVDSIIVRISYVYGYSEPKPATAFYEFIEKAIRGEDIVLNNSGMGRRDNIYVDDVVEGLLLAAKKGVSGEAYNLSSNGDLGNYLAIDEIAEVIAKEASSIQSKQIHSLVYPIEGNRKPGMKMANFKLKTLGWKVQVSLEEGIRRTISNYYAEVMRKRRL